MNKPTGKIEAATAVSHKNLAAALVAAQSELPAPRKDREVEVFSRRTQSKYKFKYATMAGMIDTDKPILAKHGLGFVQFAADGAMVTRIVHESGEHLDCPLPMPGLPDAPQEAGSLITYFKRYSYCAAFGRVADEEDDANIAEGNTYRPTVGEAAPPAKRADDKDAPFPLGPAKNKTALKDMGRELWADVMACDDADALEALLASHKPLIDQLKAGLPQWWHGGTRAVDGGGYEPYEGLGQVIERLQRDFAGIAEVGMDMRGNVLRAG